MPSYAPVAGYAVAEWGPDVDVLWIVSLADFPVVDPVVDADDATVGVE